MTQIEIVRMLLRQVVDPELGMNIIDLGLIYDIAIENNQVRILLTMTSAACPLAGVITDDVRTILSPLGFDHIDIQLTFDPPWSPDKMTADARQQLGLG